ncbi:hypothetical protein Ddye_011811 [Dipteronia dyeriana]|uniref:PGG domain-containing protein n=1 Tax=Dipteronia dyeriana TaxID=168575 RepID=A0AAE0CHP1_9ROSI|nr:hypothetical protein Ddye_011811 [Dipteronia dyeriana]
MDNQGRPIFLDELSFKIFAISVALALFSSTASVQMFLGILTSRYSEYDFLFSLPKKLITGLMSLFFSIASMMVAFAATFYIVISHPWRWVTFLIASLGAVPVTLFAWMQFPLLVDIFKSTYGPGIYKPIEIKDVYMSSSMIKLDLAKPSSRLQGWNPMGYFAPKMVSTSSMGRPTSSSVTIERSPGDPVSVLDPRVPRPQEISNVTSGNLHEVPFQSDKQN